MVRQPSSEPTDRPRYALIVGEDAEAALLEGALAEGIPVRRCAGPPRVRCPAEMGKGCPLRDQARVMVVYLTRSGGRFPCLPCYTDATVPAVGVLSGTRLPLSTTDRAALVGSEGGTLAILEGVSKLIDY